MPASAPQLRSRSALALALLAVSFVGILVACARSVPVQTTRLVPFVVPSGDTIMLLPADTVSAAALTSNEIPKRPHETIETALQGRAPGVEVIASPNGTFAVRIRGVSSFLGSNEPLYVVDGIPVTPGPGGSLSGISPYEIESIQVLKNPAETALYGVRGANGVIVIKTRRPSS